MEEGVVKNLEKLPTSFMDGPLIDSQITFDLPIRIKSQPKKCRDFIQIQLNRMTCAKDLGGFQGQQDGIHRLNQSMFKVYIVL